MAKGEKLDPNYFLPPASWSIKREVTAEKPASVAAQKALLGRVAALHNRNQ